jgi:hypothetical protein
MGTQLGHRTGGIVSANLRLVQRIIPKHLWEAVSVARGRPLQSGHSHNTFRCISSSSSPPVAGTGIPQDKSLVTGLGWRPPFSRLSTITPSVLMTLFVLHLPRAYDFLIHSSVLGWISSNLTYMCDVGFVATLCKRLMAQRGLISSVASNVREHLSH